MSGAVAPFVHREYQRHLQGPRIVVSKKCHISHRVLLMVSCLFRLQTVPRGRSPETAPSLPCRLFFFIYIFFILFFFLHFSVTEQRVMTPAKSWRLWWRQSALAGVRDRQRQTSWWSVIAAEPLTPTAGQRRQTQLLKSLKCLADVLAAAAVVVAAGCRCVIIQEALFERASWTMCCWCYPNTLCLLS